MSEPYLIEGDIIEWWDIEYLICITREKEGLAYRFFDRKGNSLCDPIIADYITIDDIQNQIINTFQDYNTPRVRYIGRCVGFDVSTYKD